MLIQERIESAAVAERGAAPARERRSRTRRGGPGSEDRFRAHSRGDGGRPGARHSRGKCSPQSSGDGRVPRRNGLAGSARRVGRCRGVRTWRRLAAPGCSRGSAPCRSHPHCCSLRFSAQHRGVPARSAPASSRESGLVGAWITVRRPGVRRRRRQTTSTSWLAPRPGDALDPATNGSSSSAGDADTMACTRRAASRARSRGSAVVVLSRCAGASRSRETVPGLTTATDSPCTRSWTARRHRSACDLSRAEQPGLEVVAVVGEGILGGTIILRKHSGSIQPSYLRFQAEPVR